MRWVLIALGGVAGLAAGLFAYAYFNLNSIIAANRSAILARMSEALGRPVEVARIDAGLGWGVEMDLQNIRVADDSAFSSHAFLQVRQIQARVKLIPLLMRSLQVTSFSIDQPRVVVVRARDGRLNLSSLGKRAEARTPSPKRSVDNRTNASSTMEVQGAEGRSGAADLTALSVRSFEIKDGTVDYRDETVSAASTKITSVNLVVKDFRADAPFAVAGSLAALGTMKDLALEGNIGPLLWDGRINPDRVPVDLKATLGPVAFAQVRTLPQLAKRIPQHVSIESPITITAQIKGDTRLVDFAAKTDLSSNHLKYPGVIDKPAGVATKISLSGRRSGNHIQLADLQATVGDFTATATDAVVSNGRVTTRLDLNDPDLANLAKMIPAAQPYAPSGAVNFSGIAVVADRKPSLEGKINLNKVGANFPGGKVPSIRNLSGAIRLDGNMAQTERLGFDLGSSHAVVDARAESIEPLNMSYDIRSDALKIDDLMPGRQAPDEALKQVAGSGKISRDGENISVTVVATSGSGNIANVAYQQLSVDAVSSGDRATINSIKFNAFNGAVGASGQATISKPPTSPTFQMMMSADKIDLQQALSSQKAKVAETIRGSLTGTIRVRGKGTNFDEIRPSLRGDGNALVDDGRLVGVNVVAEALKKVDNLPGIGVLVPPAVIEHHPELFKAQDTEIDRASLTFTIAGPRLTSHDIRASTADYTILGDGWFDMDKHLDLAARILLSRAFSAELVASRSPVAFLEDSDKRVVVPLQITGRLPKPQVSPNVKDMTEQIASHAFDSTVDLLLKGKKSIPLKGNPLDQLKGLFR